MSEIREMLVESATKIMKDFCTKELINEAESGVWAEDLWNIVEESGLTTIAVPEEAGGTGGSYGDALSLLRIAGKYSAPIPLAETLMANWLLAEVGLPISSKPLTLSPVDNNVVTFNETEGGWGVSGIVKQVPWASLVEGIVVVGKFKDQYMIAKIDPNNCLISQGSNLAGEPRNNIEIQNQFVPSNGVAFGTDGLVSRFAHLGILVKSVLMAGALERVLELTTAYTKERSQFGRPIHRFQAIQHHLASLSGETAAAKVVTDYGIEAIDINQFETEAMIAKIRVGEAASISVPIAHQVLGAIGFTDEHILQHSTRRLWAWRDENGTEVEWAEKFGEQVINAGPEALWPSVTGINKNPISSH
ncbi:hypothetical protein BTR23_09500 [Alkalihalophilus pseudofirmus]|nr:hypothetical protein BTR23_09500 [Alkalihalophilus pseudofirmus]